MRIELCQHTMHSSDWRRAKTFMIRATLNYFRHKLLIWIDPGKTSGITGRFWRGSDYGQPTRRVVVAFQLGWRENYSLFRCLEAMDQRSINKGQTRFLTDFLNSDIPNWLLRKGGAPLQRAASNRYSPTTQPIQTLGMPAVFLKAVLGGSRWQEIVYSLMVQAMALRRVYRADVIIGYAREVFLFQLLLRKKVVLIQHDVDVFAPKNKLNLIGKITSKINRYELNNASDLVVHSEWSRKNIMESFEHEKKHINVIPPAPFFQNTPAAPYKRASTEPIKVCFVGRCSEAKGFDIFLNFCGGILPDNKLEFHVFGCANHGKIVPGVKFHGWVSSQVLHETLREGVVLIFPTLSDGFGIVQYDVLQYGGIVISSTACGLVSDPNIGKLTVCVNEPDEYRSMLAVAQALLRNNPTIRVSNFKREFDVSRFSDLWQEVLNYD